MIRDPPPRIGVVVVTRDRSRSLLRTLDKLRQLPERPPVVVREAASARADPEAGPAVVGERPHPAGAGCPTGSTIQPSTSTDTACFRKATSTTSRS